MEVSLEHIRDCVMALRRAVEAIVVDAIVAESFCKPASIAALNCRCEGVEHRVEIHVRPFVIPVAHVQRDGVIVPPTRLP